MYNFIIFDVDGTLIDTESAVVESYQKVIFEEFGRHFSQEELKAGYGVPTPEALARYGIKNVDKACEQYYENLFKAFAKVQPFRGVAEILAELEKNKVPSGIVTSRNRGEIANDMSLQGLLKYFRYVISSEDTEKHKPDPEPALKLIYQAGADISKTVYLGDTYHDYMCAKNAGVDFALALWGAKYPENIHADYVLREPEEVLKLVL